MIINFLKRLKALIYGISQSLKYSSINPLRFYYYHYLPISEMEDYLILVKIKHEAHLLDKCRKNNYKKGRGLDRAELLVKLIDEFNRRNIKKNLKIISWAETVLSLYEQWRNQKKQIISIDQTASCNKSNLDSIENLLSIPSIRFWKKKEIKISQIRECVKSGILASSSCNRGAFKIGILYSSNCEDELGEANNMSLFKKSPVRIFVFVNQANYSEKFASAIDTGMFVQNFLIRANSLDLSCCVCYGSEHITPSLKILRHQFSLPSTYYCYCSILMGYGTEYVEKPPRADLDSIILPAINK